MCRALLGYDFKAYIKHAAYMRILSLGALVKFRKATISFFVSVRPSAVRIELGSQWTDFHEI
jgi:hypothetical protein